MKTNKILFIAVCVCVFQFLSQHIMCQFEPLVFQNNIQDLFISKGTQRQITVHSKALENNFLGDSPDRKVTIYLPPGYENAPDTHYPVIYLLHGFNGNNNSLFNESEYGYRLKEMLDTLIYRNIISPFIVVCPSSSTVKYYGSWYTNSAVSGDWENFIVRDLVDFIDSNYRTIPELNSRGLAGHSMGGFGAMKIAMIHPDIFSSVYSMSALLDFTQLYLVNMKNNMLQALKARDLNGLDPYILLIISTAAAFSPDTTSEPFYCHFPIDTTGTIIDSIWSKFLVNDPYTMVPAYKDSLLKLRAIQFGCGTSEILDIVLQNNHFSEALTENGIEHLYMNFNGDHMSSVQEQMKSQVLPFFSKNLDHAIPGISRNYALVDPTDTLVVEMDTDGFIYIVPANTLAVVDSIIKFEVLSSIAPANTKVTMPLNGISCGDYVVHGVSADLAVSIPLPLVVVTNSSPPNLTVENNAVPKGDTIRVTSNKDGKMYLAYSHSNPDRPPYHTKASKKVLAGNQISFATSTLKVGEVYWLYASDTFGIYSDAYPINIVSGLNIQVYSIDEVKIYPNPATNKISITTTLKSQGETQVSILSMNGRLIQRDKFQNQDRFEMDVSTIAKGIYLLRIQSSEGVKTQKLVLQ